MLLRSDFILLMLGRISTAFIAVASIRIMTGLLTPSDYGQWVLLVAFQSFCALFLINPVDQHVFRKTHAWWDNGTLFKKLRTYNLYITAVSVVVAITVIFWFQNTRTYDAKSFEIRLTAGLVVGLIVYLSTWNVLLSFTLNMLGHRIQSVIWMVISALAGLLFSALLAYYYQSAVSWMIGQVLGAIFGAIGARHALHKLSANSVPEVTHHSNEKFLDIATVRKFCIPLAVATGFMWVQNTGYRFWAGESWGVAELGIFAIGLGIAAQLSAIVETLAVQFLYPYFSRRISDSKSDAATSSALSDLINVLAPIYAVWAGFNAACASALLEIITDQRYHAAATFVVVGAMIEFLRCLTNLWSNTARAVQRTKGLILPYALGAIIVCTGVVVCSVQDMKLLEFAFVLVFAGLVTCITMALQMKRILPTSVDKKRLTLSVIFMLICFLYSIFRETSYPSLSQNLLHLLVGAIVAFAMIVVVTWRNTASDRLLAVVLRSR